MSCSDRICQYTACHALRADMLAVCPHPPCPLSIGLRAQVLLHVQGALAVTASMEWGRISLLSRRCTLQGPAGQLTRTIASVMHIVHMEVETRELPERFIHI